jgi:hypothetical protein
MKSVLTLVFMSSVLLAQCNMRQYDSAPAVNKEEQERVNSQEAAPQLNQDGAIPEVSPAAETPAPAPATELPAASEEPAAQPAL